MIKHKKLDYNLLRIYFLNTAVNENILSESLLQQNGCLTRFRSLSLLAGHEGDREQNIRTVSAVTYQQRCHW